MDPTLLTDCGSPSPHAHAHAHQVDMDVPPVERQWSCEGGTSLKDSPDSKCHSVYDSGCMDSGFLSGTNLSSSENCVSEEIKSRNFSETDSEFPSKSVCGDSKCYSRLDSGLDVGLNEQFSSLSLKSINDLKEPSSKTLDVTTRLSNNSVPTSHSTTVPSKPAPWEKYFQHNTYGDTPLHEAVLTGFIEAVAALVRIAPVPDLLDIRNDAGQTALHVALLTRQWMLVRQLVVGGASLAVRDRFGNTALHVASQVGDVDCLKALVTPVTQQELVRAGLQGRPAPVNHPLSLEERNYDGMMCVHLAAVEGHIEMLKNLVYCGADINAKESKSGRTVLHLAIELRLTGVLQFLLEEALEALPLQLEAVTYAGLTAYQLAACVDSALADSLVLRGAQQRAFPEEDSSSEEDEEEELELEMYRNFPSKYFQELKFNGGPINASA